MRQIMFLLSFLSLPVCWLNAQCPPSPAQTLNFQWSTAVGSGNEIPVRTTHGNYTSPAFPSGNGYTTTVQLRDPDNRLTVQNYENDPIIAGQPPYTFCYSTTNGGLGSPAGSQSLYSGYYMLGMFSTNATERVELEYQFSVAAYLCNLEISDIDYDASCASFCSYQDAVSVSAFNGSTPVPVTITKAAAFTDVIITGQQVIANWFAGNNGDVTASSNLGKVLLTTSQPITRVVITYTNGPDDDGVSNDHHIRIGGALASAVTVLPVTIGHFDAAWQHDKAVATLRVTNEQQIAGYELQRATANGRFEMVQQQNAANRTEYIFYDRLPAPGEQLYRVKINEHNGHTLYTPVVKLQVPERVSFSMVTGLPQTSLVVSLPGMHQLFVSIFNSNGKKMTTQQVTVSNYGVVPLPTQALPAGVYYVSVAENGNRVYSGRFVQ